MTKKSMCDKCGKKYKEKHVLDRVGEDGTRYTGETIPDICDKCFKKTIKTINILQSALMGGKLNPQEVKDFKDKKISREKLDGMLRNRSVGFYDAKQTVESIIESLRDIK